MEKHIASVSNKLIKASYTLHLVEKRLILCFISRIPSNPKDNFKFKTKVEPDTLQKLDIRLYAKLFGQQDKHALASIKKVLDPLAKREVCIREEGAKDISFNWVSCRPELIDDGYTLTIKWTKEVIPYISEQKKYFTAVTLGEVSKLSSFYAIRIYEYLKSEMGLHHKDPKYIPYITLEKFRFMLDIGEKKHIKFSSLHSNVLKPAIKAILSNTGMVVEAKLYKRARKVIGFRFIVGKEVDK